MEQLEKRVVIRANRHLAATEDLAIQAARGLPMNDNTKREERLAEIEATLVRYGVLRPGAHILLAETVSSKYP